MAPCSSNSSNSYFRCLLESSFDIFYAVDTDGIITFCTQQISRYGYNPKDVIGRPFRDFVHPDDYPRLAKDLQNSISEKGENNTPIEFRLLLPDGRSCDMEELGSVIRQDGEIVGNAGVIRDISERKLRLREHETLKRQSEFVLGATGTRMDIIDAQHTVRYVDPTTRKTLGDPSGKPCFEYFVQRTAPCEQCGVVEALRTRATVVRDHSALGEPGRTVQVTTVPFADASGEWLAAEIVVDVTERKQREQEVDCLRRQMELILGAANIGMDIIDGNYSLQYVDPQRRQLYGDPAGKTCHEYFHRLPQPCPNCHALEALQTKRHIVIERARPEKNGRVEQVTTIPFPGANGQWLVAAVTQDITEQKLSKERIEKLNQDLERRVFERTAQLERANQQLQLEIDCRRRIEEALRMNEEYFRRTFDQSPVGAAIISLDYRFLRVNDELCRITGYSRQELMQSGFPHISDPEDMVANARQLRLLQAGEIDQYQTQKRFIRMDGKFVWTRLSVRLIRDVNGHPVHFLPIMEDITSQKEAELAVLESEARFREVFESSRDGIVICDLAGRLLDCNPALLALLGYANADEMRGKTSSDISVPERRTKGARLMERLLKDGCSEEYEREFIRKDGRRVPVSIRTYLRYNTDSKAIGTWAIIRDITARQHAEMEHKKLLGRAESARKAAEESERRYRALAEATPEIVWIADPDGRTTYRNQQWFTYTGATPGPVTGFGWQSVIHPDDLPRVFEHLAEANAGADRQEFEVRLRRHDGAYRWHLLHCIASRDDKGSLLRICGTATDVHDRRRTEMGRRIVAEAAALLLSAPELETAASGVARLLVPQTADACIIDAVLADQSIQPLAIAHFDPAQEAAMRDWGQRGLLTAATLGIDAVLRSGKPAVINKPEPQAVSGIAETDETSRESLSQLCSRPRIIVPLTAYGRTQGTLTLIGAAGQAYDSMDASLAEDLALCLALRLTGGSPAK
ncbi:MAG TPA: PAS domain S-box protein [Planctomycetota bacterium]|jgi:PAS domain S-box-containing protein